MHIYQVENRTQSLIDQLVVAWEGSVRATHLFLSDKEVLDIKEYVPQALAGVQYLYVAENDEGVPLGFMGIQDRKLEMLFIDASQRGTGVGKLLLNLGLEKHKVNELAVNEQNPQAVGFYEHLGFEIVDRSELDEQGNPYPILIMKRC